MYLSNLGIALRTRFERTGSQGDLNDAVAAEREAVAATPPDHPNRAMYLSNLGVTLRTRFERTGSQADLDDAVAAGRDAVGIEVAPPRVRAVAAQEWGRAAGSGERWQEAVEGFAAAVGLLGRVAPRSLSRGDQEHLIGELGGVGSDAAACCVRAGLAGRAMELFEQGRGVLLGQALDTRTDLTALANSDPDLAGRFTALRDALDRADDRAGDGVVLAVERREAADAFERVISEIRAKPGFDDFLRPPPVGKLASAAADGPVVVVSVSRFGSHALILTSGGLEEPVPLTDLTPETVYERVNGFLTALDEVSASPAGSAGWVLGQRRLVDTLGWLWDTVAGPVLDALDIIGPPPERLSWCVSGLLSFLPLHAAGRHTTPSDAARATVIDRVISSYTPTIRALAHARRAYPATRGDAADGTGGIAGRVVVVAMPHTPDARDLPGTEAEADGLRRRFPDQVTVLTGPAATRDAVLAALPGARWAHFACHGLSDMENPSASRLLLEDHRDLPLTVVDVARLRLDDAELAFLSACSTARPGGRLTDEAIHLASAFQLAGYRHVVGTLWPIGDRQAVDIAEDIYTTLTRTGDIASAVHTATRQIRDRWPDMPSVWASHIHSGA
jgi:hypothetical protein